MRITKLLIVVELAIINSAEDGFELFKRHTISLVIADHCLRGKTGMEFAREMKQLKPEVPILICSAAIDEPPGLEFADGFLPKCRPPKVLLDTIDRLLAK